MELSVNTFFGEIAHDGTDDAGYHVYGIDQSEDIKKKKKKNTHAIVHAK